MHIHIYISLIACATANGSMVGAGTNFMNDCNEWLVNA